MSEVRTTKYIAAVRDYVRQQGHATNKELWQQLQRAFPEVSATTIHRISQRMVRRGELAQAPAAADNAARFDANTEPHDHFSCTGCGCLRDIVLPAQCREAVQAQLGGCKITGSLTIQGTCANCLANECNQQEEL